MLLRGIAPPVWYIASDCDVSPTNVVHHIWHVMPHTALLVKTPASLAAA